MAVTVETVYQGKAASSTLTSGTLVPIANRRYLLAIFAYRSDSTNPTTPTSVSLWGLTWALLESGVHDNSSSSRRAGFVYTAMTGESPSSGALSVSVTNATEIAAQLDVIDGPIDGSIVQSDLDVDLNGSSNTDSLQVTLAGSPGAESVMWTVCLWDREDAVETIAPSPGSFVALDGYYHDQGSINGAYSLTPQQSVTWSISQPPPWDDGSPMLVALVEINATSTAGNRRRRVLLTAAGR